MTKLEMIMASSWNSELVVGRPQLTILEWVLWLTLWINCAYALFHVLNIVRTLVYTRGFTVSGVHRSRALLSRPKKNKQQPEQPRGENEQPANQETTTTTTIKEEDLPAVTVQICTYNEPDAVAETIGYACQIDWPRAKLVIQVLDDSTTPGNVQATEEKVAHYQKQGFQVQHLIRPTREGYKAGNLRFHFEEIKSEFVLYLDEDHQVQPNILREVIPCFFDNKGALLNDVAFVQTPWAFYNLHENFMTEADGLLLDAQHVIDQTGRGLATGCFAYNGTGGVWRKQAIVDAGGWTWATVTEDLELACKTLLQGYRFLYLRTIPQPLELPPNFQAQVQQKYRWVKGHTQAFHFKFRSLITSNRIPWLNKIEILFQPSCCISPGNALIELIFFPFVTLERAYHTGLWVPSLLSHAVYIVGLILAVYGKVPVVDPKQQGLASTADESSTTTSDRRTVLYNSISWESCTRLPSVLLAVAFESGLSLFKTAAKLEGMLSDDAHFISTPKGNTATSRSKIKVKQRDTLIGVAGVLVGLRLLHYTLVSSPPPSTPLDTFNIFSSAVSCGNLMFLGWIGLMMVSSLGLIWMNTGYLMERFPLYVQIRKPSEKALHRMGSYFSVSSSSSSLNSQGSQPTTLGR